MDLVSVAFELSHWAQRNQYKLWTETNEAMLQTKGTLRRLVAAAVAGRKS